MGDPDATQFSWHGKLFPLACDEHGMRMRTI
jgi:hypothetical protein